MSDEKPLKSSLERSKSVRDPFFDNLKGVLILLVVFGHLIEPWISQSGAMRGIYVFLYSFHMPLFVFVAGVFSKRYVGDPVRFRGVLARYATLYLLFDLIYKVADAGGRFSWNPLTPYWIMWFLLSLCCWHAMLPLISRSRASVPIAFLVGIGAGYVAHLGYFFSLSRTLYFLPFYVVGFHLSIDGVKAMASGWGRKIIALLVLACALRLSIFLASEFDVSWLYGSRGYETFGLIGSLGGIFRGLTYALELGISFAVMMLVPKSRFWMTTIGESSLVIYVFHGFLIRAMIALGYFRGNFEASRSWPVFVMGLLLVLLLSSSFSRRVAKRVAGVVVA